MRWTPIVAVGGAVGLALASRLPFLLRADFPLNDGGLFYRMSQDVLDARHTLPAFTSYNGDSIPFAYPPAGFFIAALTAGAFHASLLNLLCILPVLANVLSVVAFFFIALSILESEWHSYLATALFALAPREFYWHIMGGGLTRSFGLLFGLIALTQARALYERPAIWRTVWCAGFASLALLSHLELGLFTAVSFLIFFLAYGRSTMGLLRLLLVGALGGVIISPWVLAVSQVHGLAPFRAASQSSEWDLIRVSISTLLKFSFTEEPLLPVIGAAGALGIVVSVLRRDWLLPAWLVAIFVVTPRSASAQASVPLAMLGARGLLDVVGVGLRLALDSDVGKRPLAVGEGIWRNRLGGAALGVLPLGYLLIANWYTAYIGDHPLHALAPEEREAMTWIAQHTPPSSVFLVLSPHLIWEEDAVGEWFPVLAVRKSLLTPQGSEWLPGGTFERRKDLHGELHRRAQGTLADLEEWFQREGLSFSHVYISRSMNIPKNGNRNREMSLEGIRQQFLSSPAYSVVYDGTGATVLVRR